MTTTLHETAQRNNTAVRVAYVDWESVACRLVRNLLADNVRVTVTEHEVAQVDAIVEAAARLLSTSLAHGRKRCTRWFWSICAADVVAIFAKSRPARQRSRPVVAIRNAAIGGLLRRVRRIGRSTGFGVLHRSVGGGQGLRVSL